MDDVLLTFYCIPSDADAIAISLRTHSAGPVHVHDETVHGRDFGGARVAEQVMGTLARCAVQLAVPQDKVTEMVDLVAKMRRARPVRWMVTPVLARGSLV